jgi:predicted ATPase
LLAHHFTQAGLSGDAIEWWGKAGRRSLEHSALVEAMAQFSHALDLIKTLPSTPTLRREEIKLRVALITPLEHVEGYAAPETKAAVERARQLIEQAEALGESLDDPLLLFSVLYGLWVANTVGFKGDICRELSTQFLTLAERQGAVAPLMIGHRLVGTSLLLIGEITESRRHLDRALDLYDPVEHQPLATRFGQDIRVATLFWRSWTLWMLGYPAAALADAEQAVQAAREIGQAGTLMFALAHTSFTNILCGVYATADRHSNECAALAEEKGNLLTWKGWALMNRGSVLAINGNATEAVQTLSTGMDAWHSSGGTLLLSGYLGNLAAAYAELGQQNESWRCIKKAMAAVEATKEGWCEAEIHRIAGEIALKLPQRDEAKAAAYFERALSVAQQQHAMSWELRAAMSMARLWRDQGKRAEARDLLALVYNWFTEGFDTRDLKEAKALLEELAG